MTEHRDVDPDTFLAMLEYLYTGHTPLDQGVDPVSLLILADKYNITRLGNLCELYITKLVDRKCSKNIEKADVDVIGLLNVSNVSTGLRFIVYLSLYYRLSKFESWTNMTFRLY